MQALNDHLQEEDQNVDGIIDHITGYKKIANFDLV